MTKKLYIIAGEASGDLHGSNLIAAIKRLNPDIEIRCWGGDLMEKAGGILVKHYKDLAFMGFLEVILNLRVILKNIAFCKQDIAEYRPDAILFIDYPGFNLRMAQFAKKMGYKTFYYISPKVWAWNQNRAKKIKKIIDHMYTIFPFETDFYKKFDYHVEYVGNPLLDQIEKYENRAITTDDLKLKSAPIIALLPGSRKQEVTRILPIMLAACKKFTDHQVVIAGAPSLSKSFYDKYITENVFYFNDITYDLLKLSSIAIVTSGTATLETALFNVPQVVCYKGSYLSYLIAKQLIKVKYISLVNLVMNREVVKELIQKDLTVSHLQNEILKILPNGESRSQLLGDYEELQQKLGKGGASAKVGKSMLKTLNW